MLLPLLFSGRICVKLVFVLPQMVEFGRIYQLSQLALEFSLWEGLQVQIQFLLIYRSLFRLLISP